MRGTPNRWLDVGKLAQLLLPKHQIVRIRYFTALVTNRPGDPLQAQRQQKYLRALQTIPILTIHYGHFLPKTKQRPLAHPPEFGPPFVKVLDTEEKGSDVNLASYLLMDGFESQYEVAVVISSNSDLQVPIEMVRTRLGKQIGVYDPSPQAKLSALQRSFLVQATAQGPSERQPVPR